MWVSSRRLLALLWKNVELFQKEKQLLYVCVYFISTLGGGMGATVRGLMVKDSQIYR